MSIIKTPYTHARCLLCKNADGLKVIDKNIRIIAMRRDGIYIPAGSKLCKPHYTSQSWNKLFVRNEAGYPWSRAQIEDMVTLLRSKELNDETAFGSQQSDVDIGIDHEQFSDLLNSSKALIATFGDAIKAAKPLQVYLFHLRKGYTYTYIATRFGTTYKTVSKWISLTRNALMQDFVPSNLGFSSIDRTHLQEHRTETSKTLYCLENPEAVVTVWDGTYIYTQKSGNYEFQKKTYSGQKLRNLVKPMLCVCPDGYIVEVFGPFEATLNDAKIMDIIFENNNELKRVFRPNDIFVLDRGFRDCKKNLEALQYIVQMPKFTDSKRPNAQLTTMQANASRLVTKTRWVVEVRNSHLKNIWAVFSNIWRPRDVLELERDIRIGASLINKYYVTISEKNKENATFIATQMQERNSALNTLHSLVSRTAFRKESKKMPLVDINSFEFPRLSIEDMKMISLGSYQLANARSYAAEHMKSSDTSTYQCFYCPSDAIHFFFGRVVTQKRIERPILVKTKMKSRFRSGVSLDSYILVDGSKRGADAIKAYCCECKHGLRTVGCCSHIMTTIYFLSYARHNGRFRPVAPYLNNAFKTCKMHSLAPGEELDTSQSGKETI